MDVSAQTRVVTTIIVPVFNEATLIESVLDRLAAYVATLADANRCELLVVDDGSSDETPAILTAWSQRHPGSARVVTHERNAGLTAAIRTGAAAALGATVVFVDADLSYAPETIGALLDARERTGAAAVIASPYMAGGRVGNVPPVRLIASRGANALLSACVLGRVKTLTGMVRAYDATALRAILSEREQGEFNSWMVAQLLHRGLPIVEIPAALVWPASRTAEPSRLGPAKLLKRVRLTLETALVLIRLGAAAVPRRPARK